MSDHELTVATVNIAGGMRAGDVNFDKFKLMADELRDFNPDIISLQEVIRVPESGRDDLKNLRSELDGEWFSFFFPHLDSFIHSHPRKWTSDIFKDDYASGRRIFQGIGILVRNRKDENNKIPISVLNLWDSERSGENENAGVIMPYPNTIYCGNRDTEPRSLMMLRLKIGEIKVLFCGTHLSAFKDEDHEIREKDVILKVRKPTVNSIKAREKQTKWMVEYIKSYQKELGPVEPVILAGDFNCEPDSKELKPLRELGLVHAHPGSPENWSNEKGWTKAPTPPYTHRNRWHPKKERRILIDHIFFTKEHFSVMDAYIVDLAQTETGAGTVSDHNPVIARLSLK